MPLITLHLLSLSPDSSTPQYLRAISSIGVKPLIASHVIRWIIHPEKLSTNTLPKTKWDLLIILPATSPLPPTYLGLDWVSQHWSITAGMPSRLLEGFKERNNRLLHPQKGDVPPITGAAENAHITKSAQSLELSSELRDWAEGFQLGQNGAVSMLNLLAFHPTKEAHESYMRYGTAFAKNIGSKRGGNAKVVGKVIVNPETETKDESEDREGWDEVALAHYPTIRHFVDMLAAEDYQEVNRKDRLPALRDTCILCTSELSPELTVDKAKL